MGKKPTKKGDASGASQKPAAKAKTDAGATEPPAAPPPGGDQAPPGGGQAATELPITINAQYTKDLSFEAPAAPRIFGALQETPPDINININVNANPLQDKVFEVMLEIHAECKVKEETAFILELQYGGVFTLNIPEEHIQPVLLIECPRLLFPFARNILADISRDGGFPPIMLGPVDFGAMYQAKLNELQQKGAAAGGAEAKAPPPTG